MTTLAFLIGTVVVVACAHWLMNKAADAIYREMIRGVERELRVLRSRTPGGSTSSDSRLPQSRLSETAGVEPTAAVEAPPATPALPSVVDHPRATAGRPQIPAGTSDSRKASCLPASTSVGAGAGHPAGRPAPTGPDLRVATRG